MQIRPPWMKGSYWVFKIVFPIAFLMGDTLAHDKLCCIQNHLSANFICHMCNVPQDKLDDPIFKYWLCDSWVLKNILKQHDHNVIDKPGYYSCYENVLFSLQLLDSQGLNMALPLESMHVICLVYMAHIVQAFSQMQKLRAYRLQPKMIMIKVYIMFLVNITKIISRSKIK